jgi:hypothetical protein
MRVCEIGPAFRRPFYEQMAKEYGALLVRVSREYDRRFP